MTDHFVFAKNDDIGAAAAEEDSSFLRICFVDTGDLSALKDCLNPRRIIIGRTGAGKSALISELANTRNSVQLSPQTLALNFIANNDVVSFFEQAGVNLSPFYNLLWRHILVVELLKAKFHIRDQSTQANYMRHIQKVLAKRDHLKEQAIEYLTQWGDKFWLTSEERVHELVSKVEGSLNASLNGASLGVPISASGAKQLSTEERAIVEQRGRTAVSQVQIRELENIVTVLSDDVFNDPQEHFYLTIDTLDEDWVDDRIRFHLIKSLMESVRKLRRLENVKIILALRHDLLDKVIHSDRTPGFQEEKYESLYIDIRWTRDQLFNMVNLRLQQLVRRRYTKQPVQFSDLFVESTDGKNTFDYILERTFCRPRDVILFVNECIRLAEGKTQITPTIIKRAEADYSYKRLQSLATEWQSVHRNLLPVLKMFEGVKSHFEMSEITREFLNAKFIDVIEEIDDVNSDRLTRSLNSLYDAQGNFSSTRGYLFRELYAIGFIGIKSTPQSPVEWSHSSRYSIAQGQLRASSKIYIHPTFYRALSINVSDVKK